MSVNKPKSDINANLRSENNDVAIIGMACRLPDAADYVSYWENLKNAVNSIREIPIDRWNTHHYYSPDSAKPNTSVSKWAGLLDDISAFDNQFFNISPREAHNMDPQQRLLLEETWHCIEDAGLKLELLQQHRASVYVGVMAIDYQQRLAESDEPTDAYACLGNYEGILANRLSFFLGLNGESKSIDTACSSSLVALHDAKRSLNIGESEYAFAAGVSIICHPWKYISFSKSRMLSPDGQCKTFDSDANGYVPGEGVGVLLLTSLKNALEKGHRIHGILKGTAVNHTGKSVSITAPRVEAQRDVIQAAQQAAGIKAEQISYIEAHGTGTSLGDPIEVEGLVQAFCSEKTHYCALGSVKTNIGHLEAAAGVAGVIKVLLMLKHAQFVSTLNVYTVNPIIDFDRSPFYLSLETAPWLTINNEIRMAGVSSFGFGGANAHVVLAEYPKQKNVSLQSVTRNDRHYPFMLSAKTAESMGHLIEQWKSFARSEKYGSLDLADISYTQIHGRESFSHRFALVADSKEDLRDQLMRAENKIFEIDEKNKVTTLTLIGCQNISLPEWKLLCENYPALASFSALCHQELIKLKYKNILKLWERGEIKSEHVSLFQLVVTYAFGEWLLENGLSPSLIVGEGVGALAGAVLCGLMDLSTAFKIALNNDKKIIINYSSPRCAFSAPFLKNSIEPLLILPDYCVNLRRSVVLDEVLLASLLFKSRLLIKNQFTFKQYIKEWELALGAAEIDIQAILNQSQDALLSSAQKIMILTALVVCYKKLSEKWNLSEKFQVHNAALAEIVELILDGALSPEMCVELLDVKTSSMNVALINEKLENSVSRINKTKAYPLLRQKSHALASIALEHWRECLCDASAAVDLSRSFISVSTTGGAEKNGATLRGYTALSLNHFVLDLWKSGALSQLNPALLPLHGHVISTPTYPFSKKQFMVALSSEKFAQLNQPLMVKVSPVADAPLSEKKKSLNLLYEKTEHLLKQLISSVLQSEANDVRPFEAFEHYGIDSIMILELNRLLEENFGDLPKTLFFEYSNLAQLTQYFVTDQRTILEKRFEISTELAAEESFSEEIVTASENAVVMDIAIIGLSGRYPEANTLTQFWENLKNARDSVIEIPKARWNHDQYFNPNRNEKNATYGKWGGFLEDYDKFDTLFFNISPKEAELIDPQERLFLETAWGALEDAGYTPESVGRRVGVFVGVTFGQYQLYGVEHSMHGNHITPESIYGSVANRVSYYCNFNGPSLAVDTMCSSSLTALHLACDSLRKQECRVALAGGVNIASHPNKYLFLARSNFLSSDGKCRSFGEGGDGYVPGEGVGAVLLKPLEAALRDRDHIYGVIKSTAINHGGKTHGYTVPNPMAQAALIKEALHRAHINPRTINYIETHGTGTNLGDPIEIRGLSKAFSDYTADKQFCPIGSLKANIGHLESAAGIAALTKVLLQLKYKKLVPSLHSEELNHNINFKDTPFYVQHQLEDWDSPDHPRRVGISSFGAGGGNAHIIVEESPTLTIPDAVKKPLYLLALSAKNNMSYQKKIVDLIEFLNHADSQEIDFSDLAYTLNAGREHFNYRGIFMASTKAAFMEALRTLHLGGNPNHYAFADVRPKERGEVELNQPVLNPKNTALYERQLQTLADTYIQGHPVDWEILHAGESKRRFSLPTYPFLRERYWVPDVPPFIPDSASDLHPLISSNRSTLEEQIFSKTFTGQEFYLKDHVIVDRSVLPGVSYLEMARIGGELSGGRRKLTSLRHVLWMKPLFFEGDSLNTSLLIYPDGDKVSFEIKSESEIHAQGELIYDEILIAEKPVDLFALEKRLSTEINRIDFYEQIKRHGFGYGASFQGIETLKCSETEVLAKLSLPPSACADARVGDFYWHPSLLDSALQATIGFSLLKKNGLENASVPFSLEKITGIQPLPETCYAYVQFAKGAKSNSQRYSVRILDDSGALLTLLEGIALRPLKNVAITPDRAKENIFYYQPVWSENALVQKSMTAVSSLIIFEEDTPRFLALSEAMLALVPTCTMIRVQAGPFFERVSSTHYIINPVNTEDFDSLLSSLIQHDIDPRYFVQAWNYYPCEISETPEVIQSYMSQGVGTLFLLSQALMRAKRKGDFSLLYIYEQESKTSHAFQQMCMGFAKTLQRENPNYHWKIMGLDRESPLSGLLEELINHLEVTAVRYRHGKRLVESMELFTPPQVDSVLRERGVYLITGGLGGIGFIIAKYLASHYQAKLILSGRTPLDAKKEEQLLELTHLGGEASYVVCDIANYQEVEQLVKASIDLFQSVNGIFHCAGVLHGSYILNKKPKDFHSAFESKVRGTLHLDKASAALNLDIFILFSSLASAFGNLGACDYASANAFMDAFSENRNLLVLENKRFGKTCSINWPLWAEGGMQVDAAAKATLKRTFGMDPLSTENALNAFEKMISLGINQVGVIQGDDRLWEGRIAPIPAEVSSPSSLETETVLVEKVRNFLKKQIGDTLKIPVEKIKQDAQFEEFGIDSIMVLDLNRALETTFGALPKTLFFEYHNLVELTDYFISSYPEKVQTLFSEQSKPMPLSPPAVPLMRARFQSLPSIVKHHQSIQDDIAIIGVSGRYPEADNLHQFWENLKAGKDSIIEIPKERWDYTLFYDPDKNKPHSTYAKWGGFINDHDKFDPLFFNIAPKEAEIMDPQERLFLQTAWSALEDAGYTPQSPDCRQIGVFVGVMYGHYQMYGAEETVKGHPLATNSSYSSIANRVSFCLNSQGPSVALDTMCSSSLTAIHFACQSILQGECHIALAGGVNIATHSNKYLLLSDGRFLSSDGKCRSFGEGGDGYVPGEGVGAVLLKPLQRALADRDIIYGVIKASAINHGGKTNGYTVPNPAAQSNLIHSALKKAHIDPRTISYVESHGTGTALGDPIEIRGLTKAFSEYTADTQFCAIGSVKSNVGHLESAAGIAALTKILLQLKYKTLVPSLHSDTLNSHINFTETPFYVQHEVNEWKSAYPLRAGLSSFGAGGSNAHLIIEEAPEIEIGGLDKPYYLITLSAKHEISLDQKIQDFLNYLDIFEGELPALANLSYTLNAGRTHHDYRCAMLVDSHDSIKHILEKMHDRTVDENYSRNFVSDTNADDATIYEKVLADVLGDIKNNAFSDALQYKASLKVLMSLYVKGYPIDWELLHQHESKRRISLPTYPFLKERYWVPDVKDGLMVKNNVEDLHPFIDANISTLEEQTFQKIFSGHEYYLRDHVINGELLLPGVVYLEMARMAAELSSPSRRVSGLKNILWIKPLIYDDQSLMTSLAIFPEGNEIAFEIRSTQDDNNTVFIHAKGEFIYDEVERFEARLNIEDLQARMTHEIQKADFYEKVERMGFHYGDSLRSIETLKSNETEVLATLILPESVSHSSQTEDLFWHPSLLDGALQATLGFLIHEKPTPESIMVPFALEKISCIQRLASTCYAYVRREESSQPRYSITIINEAGEVLVLLEGILLQAFKASAISLEKMPVALHYYQPVWIEKALKLKNLSSLPSLIIFEEDVARFSILTQTLMALSMDSQIVRVQMGDAYHMFSPKHIQINPKKSEDFERLISDLIQADSDPRYFINFWNYQSYELSKTPESIHHYITQGVGTLLSLTQALMKAKRRGEFTLLQVYEETPRKSHALQKMSMGFAKTLPRENPNYHCKIIGLDAQSGLSVVLDELMGDMSSSAVRYINAKRFVESIEPLDISEPALSGLRHQGVYLITGGLGGVGFIVARYLASRYQAKLILSGRTPLDAKKEEQLAELNSLGGEAIYVVSDIVRYVEVEALVQAAFHRFQALHGILHCAGIIRDSYILSKNIEDFYSVLDPKVLGTLHLDKASATLALDHFILFSSSSSAFGNLGQCDYASANAFMDAFAANRNAKVFAKKRQGKTCSINWPLWEEGGMRVDASARAYLKDNFGMDVLATNSALEAFEKMLGLNVNQVGVIQGEGPIEREPVLEMPTEIKVAAPIFTENSHLKEKLSDYLKVEFGRSLKVPLEKIRLNSKFQDFGIDSIMVLDLNRLFEKRFGALPKTLFFEYQNLLELTDYFLMNHAEKVQELFSDSERKMVQLAPFSISPQAHSRFASKASIKKTTVLQEDIAIIGVSGRYPQADNIDQLWENLKAGKDSIVEIPENRWDYRLSSVSAKWGGFINDHDKFDPLFFAISPKEAELMDPQERLFLEAAWSTIEDAGYSPDSPDFRKMGVFVGVMFGHYQLYGAEETLKGHPVATNSSYASIANRVSFSVNSHGPSIALDTMCSSSLTAIHLACQSLLQGESKIALAGGVNIATHSNKYLLLSEGNFLSSDGKCRSFGEGGDGYVPGEGVGSVLLKPLARALADRDTIYGVIKASAVNHGGKTNGYTVPNPVAQSAVIEEVLEKAKINPRSIHYVESHGTGTSLGDPIEIRGLSKAFSAQTSDKQFCAIGSVKSNVGHLESAAGIIALTKVLLQFKHRLLVPSLHSEKINSNINFSETPFYVQQQTQEWSGPYPRRAGISSFGAGGSNAHLIIEEAPRLSEFTSLEKPYYLITLSAKNDSVLEKRVADLLHYLQEEAHEQVPLCDISYTLNSGRVPHAYRCAFLVSSKKELKLALEKILALTPLENYFKNKVSDEAFADSEIYERVLQDVLKDLTHSLAHEVEPYKKSLSLLANLYVKGYDIDWEIVHQQESRRHIPLPTYPFLKERYWVDVRENTLSHPVDILHPLLDKNVSTFYAQEFEKTFDIGEFYLKDHKINGDILLPGTAYLEMARAAGAIAARETVQHIRDVFWMRPLIMGHHSKTAWLKIEPGDMSASFEIYTKNATENVLHAKGHLDYVATKKLPPLDVNAIRARCEWVGEKPWIYERYRALGYEYGESFQNTSILWCNETEALAQLHLTHIDKIDYSSYILHPCLMDSALRTILGIKGKLRDNFELIVPFYLERLSIYEKVPEKAWVYATMKQASDEPTDLYYDICICDENGNVCVNLSGLNGRSLEKESSSAPVLVYQPEWKIQAIPAVVADASSAAPILLVTDDAHFTLKKLDKTVITLLLSDRYEKINPRYYHVRGNEPSDFLLLWAELSQSTEKPTRIVHVLNKVEFNREDSLTLENWHEAQESGLYPLLFLFQAIEKRTPHLTMQYILAYRRNDNALSLCQEALTSFSNSLKLINPNFMLKTIELTEFKEDVLFQELQAISSERIRYDDGKRYVRTWSLVDFPAPMPSTLPLKPGGIYLITGGLGALGQILAEFFAKHYQAKLILTGRSRVDLVSQAKLDRLRTLGSEIIYVEADVSDPDAVSTLITTIKAKWGRLDGIVHTAGMASRTPLMQVNKTEFESGFSAKVYGTYYLDYFTKELDLEFFVTFSSVSAYFGDYGVGSYAYANAFMDSYMTWREQARVQHKRRGLSISLAWPYWEEGGMELSSEELAIYRDYSGLGLLSVEQGIEYFQRAIAHQSSNILIVPGDRIKIEKLLGLMTTPSIVKKTSLPAPMNSDADTFVLHYLKTLLSEATKLPLSRIEVSVDISDYGVDSVMIIAMNQRLATDFPNIRKTLLFEHKTLKSLSHYLQEAYAPRLQEMQGAPLEISSVTQNKPAENMITRFQSQPSSRAIHSVNTDAIAIIGVSGRYPESEDLEHFWGNLVSGKDCIIEIPAERWDYRPYYQPEKGLAGKICSKWGGFIKDADKFDPFYFTISPREAELMDPQERLMLETGLKVIEDAGYSVEGLHQKSHGSVGVFVGLMWNEYQLLGATKPENGGEMLYGTSNNSSISNRLSYAFDFNGPSVVIDTACSSSLVAIHMACENIRSGACQYAIAGGVNLSLHPSKYVNMSAMGMLSSDGRCCSFGEGGDGYVPGEGVGAVLLKPLNDALRDNDYIYGVIIANAVNHGGKANGFMVPNPLAQSQVIQQALKKFHVDPRSVSYVEAHGTGTPLGDPIEITGLTQAFREFTQDVQFCPIGSVKSNVGHLESAAGIAAVTKVLLQLKNKKYVKSLHSEKLNPHVDFSQTPFYVQQELQDWPKQSFPRRAGISSFGASGSNAHIIIEEAPERFILESQEKFAYLITLSAKCEASLAQKIRDLHHWLQKNPEHATLADISFTLNTGRSHFNYRAAFVVNTLENLSESLSAVNNGHKPANYFEGGLSKASNTDAAIYRKIFAGIMDEFRSEQNPDAKTYQENIETLANFYMKGYSIDWELLHQHESQRRIPLPSYPFLRERYWVTPLPLILNSIEAPKSIKVPLSKSPALHVEPDYYAENWLPYELTLKPGTLVAREHWLLFTNKKSIGAEVASMLSMRKCEVTLVFVGDDYRKLQQHYQINHRSLADMEKVFDDIGRPIHGIIHAWSDNINTINSTEELMEAQELICASSLYLAQILTRRKLEARIYFILNGVHQVTSAPIALAIKSVAQATLLGFGKTLLIEHPELKVRLIDLDPESDITVASDHILQVISSENDESIYAFRKEKCYVPRIEKTHLNHLKHGIEFHSDKSYLITGGLGGLGFAAACWMVKRGARHIILTARSEPSPKVAEKMVGLQQQGAHIRVLRLDIADATFVDAICELRDMPPIVGIIHAAGVQEREPLVKISWEHFSRVLKAKVQGTWNIQQVIARLSLKIDFVVLYSSIAALLGSNRDAPYAAGNAFLDAWAFYQRQQGVPAFCINWGPWGDVGMAAVGLELPGLISVPKGLEILGDVIAQRIPNIAIVSTEYLKFMFQFMPKPLFTWLPKLNLEDSKDRNENHAAQQWNLSLIQERIKSTLYKILPIDPSIVITDKSDFFDLGMESIRALEFGRQLQKEFTLKLSDAIIFDCPNMGELSAHLSQNLLTSNIQNVSHISVSNEESVRLFCFPYAAGTRKVFAGWADILPKEIEVYPVDYTKSVSRNFPYDLKTVREIAEELAEILPWDKPSFFFGSCLGSLVSWELAQVLQAQNRPLPQHLFVAACAAPNLYPIAMRDTTDLIDNYRQENNLPRFGREILVDEWFPLVQRELKEIGPAPFLKSLEAVGFRDLSMLMNDRTLFDVFYPRAVVDMSLALSFRSSDPEMLRPLPCPITAFDGQLDPLIRREFMRSWQLYTKGEFQLLKLQGDHYFIHDLKLEILKQIKAVFDNRIKHKNRPLGLPLS